MSEEDILQIANSLTSIGHFSSEGYYTFNKYNLLTVARAIEAKAVAREREQCAILCDNFERACRYVGDISEAIRARGE